MATGKPELPPAVVAEFDQAMAAAQSNLRRAVAVLRSVRERTSDSVATATIAAELSEHMCRAQLLGVAVAALKVLADDPGYEAELGSEGLIP
jgi:hypothetical protein